MELSSRIYVAGHSGLVGSAILRSLVAKGYKNIITKTKSELDLLDQARVTQFFEKESIDYCFIAAAKVGGIVFNRDYQADFLYENLTISTNLIHAAAKADVKKLIYLGSSCIYPKLAPQPIKEEYLLTGPLEPTNEGYAIAKIAGLKLCEKYNQQYNKQFIAVMPTNLYGPRDNFHPDHSHVIPGLLRRFHFASISKQEEVTIWGTGNPRREFLHVDDLAEGLHTIMKLYNDPSPINLGTGYDCSIRELATLIAEITNYRGKLVYDLDKPDGTPRKVLDVSKVKDLGWEPFYSLKQGLQQTYEWILENDIFADSVAKAAN